MAGLLSKYNKSLRKQMKEEGDAHILSNDPLEKYRAADRDNDLLEVVFSYADKDGNLFMRDSSGVEVRLLYDDIIAAMPYYNTYIKDRYIGNTFVAKVKEIDEKNNVVTVVSARSNVKATKTRIIAEIQKALSDGHSPLVVGRVVRVTRDRVYVNILCKEIFGICAIKYWRQGFVQDLIAEVHEGELLEFEITGEMTRKDSSNFKRKAYMLSRVKLTPDPWEMVSDKITEGSAIIVKCIDRPANKPYWWGASDLVPGMSIMCDFNKKVTEIKKGRCYKCKVFRLDREKRRFQATPIEATAEGFDPKTFDNLKILEGTRSKG